MLLVEHCRIVVAYISQLMEKKRIIGIQWHQNNCFQQIQIIDLRGVLLCVLRFRACYIKFPFFRLLTVDEQDNVKTSIYCIIVYLYYLWFDT